MERQFQREMQTIREKVIQMGTLSEEAVFHAVNSFLNKAEAEAQNVIAKDAAINDLEIIIDKEVFQYIALNQPVAADLRFLFSVLKMNKDIERVGDHAVNIAKSVQHCVQLDEPFLRVTQLDTMAKMTRQMLHEVLTSFIKSDTALALSILEQDEHVDELNHSITRAMIDKVKKNEVNIEMALELIRVSKNLERIADLSTNLAEDVIFQANAHDVKHQYRHWTGDNKKSISENI